MRMCVSESMEKLGALGVVCMVLLETYKRGVHKCHKGLGERLKLP
jgi:hypothetical protein